MSINLRSRGKSIDCVIQRKNLTSSDWLVGCMDEVDGVERASICGVRTDVHIPVTIIHTCEHW
jgi:hypothetical protein